MLPPQAAPHKSIEGRGRFVSGGADGREAGGAGGERAGNKPLEAPLSHTPVPKLLHWSWGQAQGERERVEGGGCSACSSSAPACAFENMEPVCKDMPRGPASGPF